MVHSGLPSSNTRHVNLLLLILLAAPILPAPVLAQTNLGPEQFPTPSPPPNSETLQGAPSSSSNLIQTYVETISQSSYILGPGDVLQFNMFGQPELFTAPTRVLVDGTVSLPFVGRVPVAGKSLQQSQQDITALYTRFYKRPNITITLTQPRTRLLGISGEVRRPGTYQIPGADQIPTVTDLIRLAGGTNQSADLTRVEVRRPRLKGPDQIISLNLLRLLEEGDLGQNLDLRDGDTVLIPASNQLDIPKSALLADASFAAERSEPINIAVIGEVYRPGPHTIRPGSSVIEQAGEAGSGSTGSFAPPTVSQAIQTAGGIRPEADLRTIQVRRRARTGAEQLIDVDLWKLLKEGDLRQDIALQEGDTVIVPKGLTLASSELTELATTTFSPATINVNVVGEVIRPGVVQVQPNTPLSTAISAAGGFRPGRANSSTVKLLRLTPEGTIEERKVKVDLSKPLDNDTNPSMRNNDVVVVGRNGLTSFSDTFSQILSPFRLGFGAINPFF